MIVYTPVSSDGYELCHPINDDNFETINVLINGESRQGAWKPIETKIICEDEGQQLIESDSPWLGPHALIFRPSVIKKIGDLLREHGELLDLRCREAEVVIFNPTKVLNALDETKSSVLRFKDGRIMRINRYVLRPEVVQDAHIFKIPNLRVSPTFVSEHFVELWTSAGLTGIDFEKVWEA